MSQISRLDSGSCGGNEGPALVTVSSSRAGLTERLRCESRLGGGEGEPVGVGRGILRGKTACGPHEDSARGFSKGARRSECQERTRGSSGGGQQGTATRSCKLFGPLALVFLLHEMGRLGWAHMI